MWRGVGLPFSVCAPIALLPERAFAPLSASAPIALLPEGAFAPLSAAAFGAALESAMGPLRTRGGELVHHRGDPHEVAETLH